MIGSLDSAAVRCWRGVHEAGGAWACLTLRVSNFELSRNLDSVTVPPRHHSDRPLDRHFQRLTTTKDKAQAKKLAGQPLIVALVQSRGHQFSGLAWKSALVAYFFFVQQKQRKHHNGHKLPHLSAYRMPYGVSRYR